MSCAQKAVFNNTDRSFEQDVSPQLQRAKCKNPGVRPASLQTSTDCQVPELNGEDKLSDIGVIRT